MVGVWQPQQGMRAEAEDVFTEHREAWMILGMVVCGMAVVCVYRRTRRISHIEDLPRDCVGMRLSGIATSVSDGDGFRFFHTPWFRRRAFTPVDGKLYVRLSGIDAPEVRHFHMPEQAFAKESKEYLRKLVLNRKVRIKIVGIDRYNRVLAIVHVPGWFFGTNVNLRMVESGHACVYTGKDAIYDRYEKAMRDAEAKAMEDKRGMWKFPDVVTPMEYKRMHRSIKK